MGRKYKFHEHDQLYFVNFATVQWVDVFTPPCYRKSLFAAASLPLVAFRQVDDMLLRLLSTSIYCSELIFSTFSH